MTRQEFESRYQLLRPLEGEAKRTYLARNRSGAIVMVHFLDMHPHRWGDGRLGRLETLDPARRERIIDIVEDDAEGVVITRFLMDFHSFDSWMGGSTSAAGAAAPEADGLIEDDIGTSPPTRDPAVPAASEPSALPPTLGAFPALTEPPVSREETRKEDEGKTAEPSSSASAPPPMGEFTAAFLAPTAEDLYPPPPEQTPSTPSSLPNRPDDDAAEVQPGDEPEAERPSSDSSSRETAAGAGDLPDEPGEFTKIFQAQSIPADPEGAQSGSDLPPFGEPAKLSVEAPMTEGRAQPSASDRAEEDVEPSAEVTPPAARDAPQGEPAAIDRVDDAPAPTGEGEFTRMFRAAEIPDEAPAPSPEPTTPPPAPAPPVEPRAPSESRPEAPAADPDRAPPAPTGEGEFTRMFRAAEIPDEAPAPSPEPATPPKPPTPSIEPQSPPAAPTPRAAIPAPDAVAPQPDAATPPAATKGEFTTMFEKLAPTQPPPSLPSQPTQPASGRDTPWPSIDQHDQQDDRYRQSLFGGTPAPPYPPTTPPTPRVDGPGVFPVDPELPPLPAQMTPPPAPPPQAGGEYTRMISAFAPTPAADPTAAPPAASESPSAGSGLAKKAGDAAVREASFRAPRFGLLAGFGAVTFGVFALVLYLIMKSFMLPTEAEPEAAPEPATAPAPATAAGPNDALPPP